MMLSDLVKGATKYGIEITPDFLLVGKAIMTIEGVGKDDHLVEATVIMDCLGNTEDCWSSPVCLNGHDAKRVADDVSKYVRLETHFTIIRVISRRTS